MRANELIELGWRVCGELIDEDNKKFLFVVEDDEGNWMILHFYTAPNNTPMVEGFYERSLNDYFYYSLCDDPNRFLETFDKFRIYAKPDWYDIEENWVNEQKDFITKIKSIYDTN